MNSDLNISSHCYIGYIGNKPVCFFAVIHHPHNQIRKFKRGHRLVVLPDYQGLGIGHKFSSYIADKYVRDGYRFIITSSTKSLYKQRLIDKRWIITRKGRGKTHLGKESLRITSVNSKLSFSYEYIGNAAKKSTK